MNMLIAALVFVPLLAVTIAGLLWSLGASWPIRDKALLARTVVGRPGAGRVPRLAALLAALLSLAAGIVALSLADHESGGAGLTLLGFVCGALFLARGAAGFSPGWREAFPEEPFAGLDRRLYSPLALGLGLGFLLLCIMRLIP